MTYDFAAQFESISDWRANQRLLTQYLETEMFQLVYATKQGALRARFAVEHLSWAQRMDKISQFSQIVYNAVKPQNGAPLAFPEYRQVWLFLQVDHHCSCQNVVTPIIIVS